MVNSEKIKVFLWTLFYLPQYKFKYWLKRNDRKKLNILNSYKTVQHILDTNCSVSRFGDGELQMISHYLTKGNKDNFHVDTFQDYNEDLGKRLFNILSDDLNGLLLCLPYQLKDSSISKLGASLFWEREFLGRQEIFKKCVKGKQLGDTNFTRFYLDRTDIKNYNHYIQLLKNIWDKREVLIIEGEFSRLGVGNDFFANSGSIKRVICPAKNSYNKYNDILNYVQQHDKSALILIALGHTATVLAYDLHKLGFQALDIGHNT